MKEIWKDVVGYEGYYQISNFGNVRSIERNGTKKGAKNGMFGKRAWNSGVKIEKTPEMQKNFTKKALNNNELAYIHYENNRYRVRIKFLKINKNFILKEDAIAFRNLKLLEN